ncbi:RNA polymerase factor sigma-54 [Aestuariispira insulae]|uniref:RNA polymerase sigma-54 factor n=1 Tax=Aestuariispira insulae TaxID=1461337 RepID=A0A3D9HAJ5_9PROT|nr:RNA polymerase factor sigma-54 [Aestuariispira insulae]RED46201.1 RNA polymerase RpoN-/SigL-like sigma 54 subunit [Aestuariispira insulae]
MALGPRLDLRQTQSLVMTPQLQQAIKLLQLSHLELASFVENELETNPMLERDEGQNDQPADQNDGPDTSAGVDGQNSDSLELLSPSQMADGADAPLDTDYRNEYDQDIAGPGAVAPNSMGESLNISGTGGRSDFSDDSMNLEATLSEAETLTDILTDQLQIDITDPAERIIGLHLIDMVDESGWITGDLEEVAKILGCGFDQVETVLAKLQSFDPPGICARNLQECLEIQLREQNRLDPAMQALLNNLHLLAARDAKALLRICGVDEEDLTEMVAEIRALNPKPAAAFDHSVAQPVVPDVLMRSNPEGGWFIELNPETLPRVLVNEQYYATINGNTRSKEEKDYLSERYQTANWLVKSLHQRATTILKVASEIVVQQDGFFHHGVSRLRPLVLRDIAEAIEMHESTVSRVTSNKYISTPRGLYELKYFFTSAIASTGFGDAHSAEAVKHRIAKLIDEESPKAILSDDKIVEMLKDDGMDIARRTVAKYREALKIPSSVQRRREKNRAL